MASWMAYCAAVAVLLGAGALALESALAAHRRPTRWVWAAALAACLAFAAAARWMPRAAETPLVPPAAQMDGAPAPSMGGDARAPASATRRRIDLAAMDQPLALLWAASTAAAMLMLLIGWGVLERRRRTWRAETVDGVPVLFSADTGPAVIGFLRGRIVLPEWVRDAGDDVRALLLAHEAEHLRAGDPRLVAFGMMSVALMPWNPAAWWMLRRLRLAVEVDCDARVLARRADVRRYGALLLEVGRRASSPTLVMAAFSEPASFLERRIRMMTQPRARAPWMRTAGFGGLAAALLTAACETPSPVNPSPVEVQRAYGADGAAQGLASAPLTPRQAVERYYPQVLTSGMGPVELVFAVDDDEVVFHRLLRRPEPTPGQAGLNLRRMSELDGLVDADRIHTIDVLGHDAGKMGPDPVNVVWIRVGEPGQAPTGQRRASAETRVRSPEPEASARGMATLEASARFRREHEAQIAAVRAGLAQRHPGVLRGGTPSGEYVYFLADASGRIVNSGTSRLRPIGGWSSVDLKADINALHPGLRVMHSFHYAGMPVNGGRRANVAWVTVEG